MQYQTSGPGLKNKKQKTKKTQQMWKIKAAAAASPSC